jgi:hypothetical protein
LLLHLASIPILLLLHFEVPGIDRPCSSLKLLAYTGQFLVPDLFYSDSVSALEENNRRRTECLCSRDPIWSFRDSQIGLEERKGAHVEGLVHSIAPSEEETTNDWLSSVVGPTCKLESTDFRLVFSQIADSRAFEERHPLLQGGGLRNLLDMLLMRTDPSSYCMFLDSSRTSVSTYSVILQLF